MVNFVATTRLNGKKETQEDATHAGRLLQIERSFFAFIVTNKFEKAAVVFGYGNFSVN